MSRIPITRRRASAVATAAALLVTAAGCGSDSSYSNKPRPPAPIILTAAIAKDAVTVSPAVFGAGPVSLVITNLTDTAQQITFESEGRGPGFRQQTGPINPRDTATLKVDVPQGPARVAVAGDAIAAAHLRVGPQRKSAQNDLLQP